MPELADVLDARTCGRGLDKAALRYLRTCLLSFVFFTVLVGRVEPGFALLVAFRAKKCGTLADSVTQVRP